MSKELGIHLAVVDNGFVYVGRVVEEEHYYVVIQGYNVRKAGTSRGFGQLAFEGPMKESALDPCPPIMVPKGRLCHFIECADVWKKHIK
jgi:hypothetical protein